MEHSTQSLIDVSHAKIAVEGEHAGGNAFENGFHLAAALIEFRIGSAQIPAGSFNLPATALQVLSHAVEGAHQVTDFVSGTDIDAVIEASARDFLRCFRQGGKRTCHDLSEEQGQPCGDEQHHHREQQKQSHVGAANDAAFAGKIVVTLLAGFHLANGLGKFVGQRNGDEDLAAALNGSAAQGVVHALPGELSGTLRLRPRAMGRESFSTGQGAGALIAGLCVSVSNGERESSLQSDFMVLKLVSHAGEPVAREAAFDFRRGGHARQPRRGRSAWHSLASNVTMA